MLDFTDMNFYSSPAMDLPRIGDQNQKPRQKEDPPEHLQNNSRIISVDIFTSISMFIS